MQKSSTSLKDIQTFILKKPIKFFIILFAAGFAIQLLIQIVYWIGYWKGIPTDFTAGDVLMYWGTFFAFLGTVALGALALWQNTRLNNVNERLLEIEEAKLCPMLDITQFEKHSTTPYKVRHPRTNKEILLLFLDEKYCEITDDLTITNKHDDLTWVFNFENTSETKIIGFMFLNVNVAYYTTGGLMHEYQSQITQISGNENFNPHQQKPILISGIDNIFKDQGVRINNIVSMNLSFFVTNAIGDRYKLEMSCFVNGFHPTDMVMYPNVYRKDYKKPQKLT